MNTRAGGWKQQQCTVAGLALSWLAYVGWLVWLAYERRWVGVALWLVLVPLLRLALFRYFPGVSRFLGYGRIGDAVPAQVSRAPVAVKFYSFFSCPFCPIVLRRLEALQKEMGFTLESIDVTLHPQLLMSQQIRSVPVVEAGGHRLVGNSTSEELAGLIAAVAAVSPMKAA